MYGCNHTLTSGYYMMMAQSIRGKRVGGEIFFKKNVEKKKGRKKKKKNFF